MSFKFRRGIEADRTGVTPAQGEPLYTTDNKELYIGDGSTAGGVLIGPGVAGGFQTANDATSGIALSGFLMGYDGATWRPSERFFQPSGYQVPSGVYRVASEFYQPSGYQVPSGDYATVTQGHTLWQQSGLYEPSGTVEVGIDAHIAALDPHDQYLTELAALSLYQSSGFLTVGVSGATQKENITSIQFNTGTVVTSVGTIAHVSGASGGGGGGGATSLAGLSDVTTTEPFATGDILRYGGSAFNDVQGDIYFEPSGFSYEKSISDSKYAISGLYEISGTVDSHESIWDHSTFSVNGHTHTVSNITDIATNYQASGLYQPSGSYKLTTDFFQPSGYQVPSGDYTTVAQGNVLWATAAQGATADSALQDITGEPISDLSNVSANTPTSGHLLSYDGSVWLPASSGYQVPSGDYATVAQGNSLWNVNTIDGQTDTTIGTKVSGHVLSWDGLAWVNAISGQAGAGGTHTLLGNTHTDTTGSATSGHILGYDGINWRATTSGAGGGSTTLTALTDTNIAGHTSGQVLRSDGTDWHAATVNQSVNASGWIERVGPGALPNPAPSGTRFIVLSSGTTVADEVFISMQTTGGSWQWVNLISAP